MRVRVKRIKFNGVVVHLFDEAQEHEDNIVKAIIYIHHYTTRIQHRKNHQKIEWRESILPLNWGTASETRRSTTSLESRLDGLSTTVHAQARHRETRKEEEHVEDLVIPRCAAAEERTLPATDGEPAVADVVLRSVKLEVVACDEERGERVGELHDADGRDET